MEKLKIINFILLFLLFAYFRAEAAWDILADADLRYSATVPQIEHNLSVESVGLSVRKTVADSRGDRWIFYGLGDIMHNFEHPKVHELYAMLKGPLGVWNVTTGRFRLLYGLLREYSADRLLVKTPEKATLGIKADNGIMFSGLTERFDYAISLTQGYGMGDIQGIGNGVFTARLGKQIGEFGDGNMGLSAMAGTTNDEHGETESRRRVAGIDFTRYSGQSILRGEVSWGTVNDCLLASAYVGYDFALSAAFDINTAVSLIQKGEDAKNSIFAGLTHNSRHAILRGGYSYVFGNEETHTFTIQLYRLFSLI